MTGVLIALLIPRAFPPEWGILGEPAVVGGAAIAIAVCLDAILGDPRTALHPVRLIGGFAASAERLCRRLFRERSAGVFAWLLVLLVTIATAAGLLGATALIAEAIAGTTGAALHLAMSSFIIYVSFSARDLDRHARHVFDALEIGDTEEARRRVGMIVSRDTASLDSDGVARATVESVAENSGDAIAGPLLYAALLGPLGAIAYRAINTMDAMFGYRNDRYLVFGRCAARADDAVNFLPSRLTALAVCVAGMGRRRILHSLRIVGRDARKHESPNAGFPETATAAVLGIRLGGPGVYFGAAREKATLGDVTRSIESRDIVRATRLMWGTAVLLTIAAFCVRVLILAPLG